jgi:hypothetical protein
LRPASSLFFKSLEFGFSPSRINVSAATIWQILKTFFYSRRSHKGQELVKDCELKPSTLRLPLSVRVALIDKTIEARFSRLTHWGL